jgi:small-conductance mechanosensitive channel
MRYPAKKILSVVLSIAVFLLASHVFAQEQTSGDQTPATTRDKPVSAPDLADIIPQATKLSADLATLKNRATDLLDVSGFEKNYAGIEEKLQGAAAQLQQIKDSKDGDPDKFAEIRMVIERQKELLEEISQPLSETIRQLGAWRNHWQAQQQQWNTWQSIILKDGELDPLQSIFAKAMATIDEALEIIHSQLGQMLTVQERAGNIQAKIIALNAEIDALILAARSGVRVNISPPMFSPSYFSQYSKQLWYALLKGLSESSWVGTRFVDQQGLIVFLQIFFSLLVIIAVYRKRQVINDSQRWRFLAERPFAAGIFFGTIVFMSFYQYRGLQDTLQLYLAIVGGISFARLISALNLVSWKRQFVYGVMIVYIISRLLQVIMLPLPLMRLFTVMTPLAGLIFCLRWADETRHQKGSGVYRWALRLSACYLAFVILAEIWGAYDDMSGAIKGLLSLGFNLGSQRITLGLVIISAGILYGSFLASSIIQKLLTDQVLARRRVEIGVQIAIARLVHYVLIFIGFVMALLALGFDFTKLTIVLSALGVGIGFGLQSVVNNFVTGN